MNGYIPLSRRLFEHELWNEKRRFNRVEAWIDLLRSARFEAGKTTILIGNTPVEIFRGEMAVSLRYLGERWNWSKNKVDGFLAYLIKADMIKKRTAQGTQQTIISICKYGYYNGGGGESGTLCGTIKGQGSDTLGTNNKKENKVKTLNIKAGLKKGQIITPKTETKKEKLLNRFKNGN